jgi:hypothetical protein
MPFFDREPQDPAHRSGIRSMAQASRYTASIGRLGLQRGERLKSPSSATVLRDGELDPGANRAVSGSMVLNLQ